MLSLKFLLFAWHSLRSHHCHHNIYRPCRLMPVLVDWSVCPTHPHYEINLTKYHPIMSLFSKPHGLPMVPCILDSSSPPYFPLFSDKETSALSSWFLYSLQQAFCCLSPSPSLLRLFSYLECLFLCFRPDWLNFFLPSRTSSAPASSAKAFIRLQPHQSFLNLGSKPFIWLLKQ